MKFKITLRISFPELLPWSVVRHAVQCSLRGTSVHHHNCQHVVHDVGTLWTIRHLHHPLTLRQHHFHHDLLRRDGTQDRRFPTLLLQSSVEYIRSSHRPPLHCRYIHLTNLHGDEFFWEGKFLLRRPASILHQDLVGDFFIHKLIQNSWDPTLNWSSQRLSTFI